MADGDPGSPVARRDKQTQDSTPLPYDIYTAKIITAASARRYQKNTL